MVITTMIVLMLPGFAGQGVVRDPSPFSPLESFFDKSWRPSEIELVD